MKKHRVLLIDDDHMIIRAFSRLLRDEDYELITAMTGEEAIRIIQENPVSVVVADEVLPDVDGSFILEALMRNFPRTQRIIFTGWPLKGLDWERVGACKPFAVISKPDVDDELRKVIRAAIQEYERQNPQAFNLSGTS